MTLSISAVFLFSVMSAVAEDVERKIRDIKPGRRVEVTLVSGEKITGNVGPSPTSGYFALATPKAGTREIAIADVRSVKSKMNTKEKWAIGLAIYGGVMLLVALTLGG